MSTLRIPQAEPERAWPRRRIDWIAVALVAMTGFATLATLYRFFTFIAWA